MPAGDVEPIVLALVVAYTVSIIVLNILDQAPSTLKHGGPYYAWIIIFAVPIKVALVAILLGVPWWIVALWYVGMAAASLIIATRFKGGA